MCADVDHHGLRLDPSTPEDTFTISWLGVFNSAGKLENSVTGAWHLRCAHRSGRVAWHAWEEARCSCAPHARMTDIVERKSILLYECEFTDGGRLNSVTKGQVVQALKEYPARIKRLPKTWVPKTQTLQDKVKSKGKGRKR